jgi:hypothetical protein
VDVSRVDVRIDELVLTGVDARDRDRVVNAIQQALAERLADADVLRSLVRAGSRELVTAADAGGHRARTEAVGKSIGASIADALAGGRIAASQKGLS